MIEYDKVAIIDDEIEIINIIEPVLEEIGFRTIIKIQKASDLFKTYDENINLIILDLFMPDVDGIEVLRFLGERKSKTHIILTSGYSRQILSSAERVAKAYGLNILGSISKPFSIDTIIDMIESYNSNSKINTKKIEKEIDFSLEFFKEVLDKKYFVVYYQPQIDLIKKEVLGFEALVRIQHPEYGLIFPDQFLKQIEAYNLVSEMTEYIINEALFFFGYLKKLGIEKRISINISILDLIDTSMPEHLISLINKYDLNPDQIVMELIETGQIGNNPQSLEILTRLYMKGIRLSIDDFGTGYSSLEQLIKAPFRELKIDKGFVFELIKNPDYRTIIESTVSLAHKLNLKVVAEGIENIEVRQILCEIGVDIGQGYHFSIPIPSKGIIDFLKKFSYK
jgi:EAL domain-containing protein (putative c-di-GMP-specific phosphodiesterase class I)/CheY-like chemotaxis protein